MAVEVASRAERLSTLRHLARVCPGHIVRTHVLGQLDIAHELAGTVGHWAVDGLNCTVKTHVSGQVPRCAEPLTAAASTADVRALASVRLHVLRKRVLAVEPTPTSNVWALKSFGVWVREHVGRDHKSVELEVVLHV